MRKYIGLMGIIGFMGILPIGPVNAILAQNSDRFPDSIDKDFQPKGALDLRDNSVYLQVDGRTFFIDNEYFGDRVSGYTLPGFVLQPKVGWRANDKFTLKGGVHWLYYWGARDYPAATAYGAYPLYDSAAGSMHLLPWLQARIDFSNHLWLTLGNLSPSSHFLPLPLYNSELTMVGDPEAGAKLEWNTRWAVGEVWVDWREYIWDRSPVPERFTAGLSGGLRDTHDLWTLYMPLFFVVQHEGGQNMSVSHNINNNFNAGGGLGVTLGNRKGPGVLDISCRGLWYHQHGNAAIPFSSGWGIYPELEIFVNNYNNKWRFLASYWYGKDFVPLLGSWHFSNLSANTPGLTFDRTRVITLQLEWQWQVFPDDAYHLHLYGTLYHYLPSTGTFADGTTMEYGHRNQFSIGASLSFYPTIRLHY